MYVCIHTYPRKTTRDRLAVIQYANGAHNALSLEECTKADDVLRQNAQLDPSAVANRLRGAFGGKDVDTDDEAAVKSGPACVRCYGKPKRRLPR